MHESAFDSYVTTESRLDSHVALHRVGFSLLKHVEANIPQSSLSSEGPKYQHHVNALCNNGYLSHRTPHCANVDEASCSLLLTSHSPHLSTGVSCLFSRFLKSPEFLSLPLMRSSAFGANYADGSRIRCTAVQVGEKSLTAKEGSLNRTMKSSFSDLCIKYDDVRNVDRMAAVQVRPSTVLDFGRLSLLSATITGLLRGMPPSCGSTARVRFSSV